jgi:hypothetical protein
MKRLLLLSAVALTGMGANLNAQSVTYDFNTTPTFFATLQDPNGIYNQSANFDLVSKTGALSNFDGATFDSSMIIDLEEGDVFAADQTNLNNTFIGCTGNPSRVTWMYGLGCTSLEEYQQKAADGKLDYQAATEADFVPTKHALAFLRNASTASRANTFVQFPAVQGPLTLSVWAGHAGGSYVAGGLKFIITPIINGTAGEPIEVVKADATAKRFYRFDYTISSADKVAVRITNNGNEYYLYHVMITPSGSDAITTVFDDKEDANAPAYNVLGVRVGKDYKGIVIKNGKKLIQK